VVAQEERAQANLEKRDVLFGTPSLSQCLTASVVNLSGTRSLRGAGVRDAQVEIIRLRSFRDGADAGKER
ncbi:MAG TPA: hypothetical protein VMU22_09295, partial [Rhizomicrobium sp.]|nr:hypothetical protein [Rhizomicrobium sp.]